MFDRPVILVPHVTQHVTREVTKQVHEHRAPTDESVRLLAEFEAKARERIVEAIHVGDGVFECVVHIEKSFADDAVRLMAVFSLNGKKLTAEFKEHGHRVERKAALLGLRDAIAKEIAHQILVPALERLDAHSSLELLGKFKTERTVP